MPTICTLVAIGIDPSRLLSADGALRTFNWEMVCPSAGATANVGVGGSVVGDGRGVCVGGRVEVMIISGVGVGVSGMAATSALQAVFTSKSKVEMMNRVGCGGIRFTAQLYPRFR